jgi:SH3-like domain-containing protein
MVVFARRLGAVALLVAALAPGLPPPASGAATLGPVTNMPLPRFVSMRAETANARRGPSLSHRVDWTFVRRGMPLEVTAEYGNWRRVRDADGAGGWVHHTLLSGIRTVVVRADGPAPLRAAAGDDAAIRALVEPGVVARLEACEDAWCELDADGVEGWAPRAILWGVGPDEDFE